MASTTRRPYDGSARATAEARILTAVEELLGERLGYTQLSVERIAMRAGLSRSAFYLHFRDKTELVLRLNGVLKAGVYEIAESWRPDAPDGGLEGLVRVYERIIAYYRQRPAVLVAIHEVAAYDETVRDRLAEEQERFIARTAGLLAAEQAAGRTASDFDPLTAARVMTWSGERVIAHHLAAQVITDSEMARELGRSRWYGYYRAG